MRFHTQTAGVSLTAQQPEVNIVRTALEALAAVLGGTQSLHTNSFDEALALPTEDAVRIALRTQQVIAHETGVVNTIDPLGGSYYVEDLTNRLEARPTTTSTGSRSSAASIAAIKENFQQREIAEASFRYQPRSRPSSASSSASTATSSRTRAELEILRIDPASSRSRSTASRACARAATRRGRARARDAEGGAREDANLMPLLVDASRAYVTLGEMCDALREVWGIWRETPVF
jgi:methylmalonyl-CoA mutase N-terminal domain/subunit